MYKITYTDTVDNKTVHLSSIKEAVEFVVTPDPFRHDRSIDILEAKVKMLTAIIGIMLDIMYNKERPETSKSAQLMEILQYEVLVENS